MQIKKLAPSLMEQWIGIYQRERPNLNVNAISGEALAAYVRDNCAAEPVEDEAIFRAVCDAVLRNAFYAAKLPAGKAPRPAAFLRSDGTTIGIDLETGYFTVNSDMKLRDELTYVKGLDEADLSNALRTVDWLRCKKLFKRNVGKRGS